MRTLTTAIFAACLLTACQGSTNHGTFTPYRRVEKTTESAVRLSDADKKLLLKAGAKYVGELETDSSVSMEAAKVGATHYLEVSPGRYVLFRVEPSRWNELTAQLRPSTTPTENDAVSTTMLTSAH